LPKRPGRKPGRRHWPITVLPAGLGGPWLAWRDPLASHA
jgi:hypothetical protein